MKRMVLVVLVGLLVGSGSTALSQNIRTDYSATGDPPAISGFPTTVGGSYFDPVFGTKIIRLTITGNCLTPYGYWRSFNADSSLILVECGQGNSPLLHFDKKDESIQAWGATANTIQDGEPVNLLVEGSLWSDSNPNILYVLGGPINPAPAPSPITLLYRIDVSKNGAARFGTAANELAANCNTANALGCLRNFDGNFTWPPGVHYLNQGMGKSEDDNVFTFYTSPANASSTAVGTYVLSTDTFTPYSNPNNNFIHESQVNKSGYFDYVTYRQKSCTTNADCTSPRTCANGKCFLGPGSSDDWLWSISSGGGGSSGASYTVDGGHYDLGRSLIIAASDAAGVDTIAYSTTSEPTPASILSYQISNGSPLCNSSCNVSADCPGATCNTTSHKCNSATTCSNDSFCPGSTCDTQSSLCILSRPCYAIDLSLRSQDERVALASTYTGLNCVPGSSCTSIPGSIDYYQYPFNNELMLTYTNNSSTPSSQSFIRLAHTRDVYTDSLTNYSHQTKATIDRLARYIAFTSDQGDSSHTDVYLAEIPQVTHPSVGRSTNGWNTPFHVDLAGNLWKGINGGFSWATVSAPASGVILTGGIVRSVNTGTSSNDSIWATGSNGHLYQYWSYTTSESWSWTDLSSVGTASSCAAVGSPAVATSGSTIQVVVRCGGGPSNAKNGHLGLFALTSSWSFTDLGVPATGVTATGNPAITYQSGAYVFTVGSDGNLHQSSGGVWSNLGSPVGGFAGSPAVVKTSTSYTPILLTTTNGTIWEHNLWANTSTDHSAPTDCAGFESSAVIGDVAADATNSWLYAFARCRTGDKIGVLQYDGTSWSWRTSFSFSQSGFPLSVMPLAQPGAGHGVFNNSTILSVKMFTQTSTGEQLEYDISPLATPATYDKGTGANP